MEVKQGAQAIAHSVKKCKPDVCSMYPITPSTELPEEIAQLVADGELDATIIRVESEFSAISGCVGASAAGSRAYTATSSQGLALMTEVLFAASGMRLPIVINVVNRALSAPINIWNDQQDSISQRDNGWLQIYCESNQEAVDTTIQSFKIAEDEDVLLPIMCCTDGYILSHTYEPVELPDEEEVQEFLPEYDPDHAYLDPENPMTQGPFAYPKPYAALRKDLSDAVNGSKEIVKRVHDEFAEKFGRSYGNGLIEEYKNDKDTALVSMGSICGTIKSTLDNRNDAGLMRIRCYRPFPEEEIKKALEGKDQVIVLEKNVSMGHGSGALYNEIKSILPRSTTVHDIVVGLGGTDIAEEDINNMIDSLSNKENGVKRWLLEKGGKLQKNRGEK